ncbi:MAG: hypothetical protein AMXMBFR13_37630 [Phycisphaerae bacterium]
MADASSSPPIQPDRRANALRETLANRWFIVCAVVLLVFAVGFEVLTRDLTLVKTAAPLRAPLDQLNQQKLQPYEMFGPPKIIQADVLDALGTKDYIQWTLVDKTAGEEVRLSDIVYLFVTYYTGKPDQVPHVPEVCFYGSGFQEAGNRLITLEVPELAEKDREVPFQVLQFAKSSSLGGEESRIVIYTFRTNDEWRADRDGVRRVVGNPLASHAYFSKLEVGLTLPPGENDPAAVERAIETAKRFLKIVIPVLVRDHWPDWQATIADAQNK